MFLTTRLGILNSARFGWGRSSVGRAPQWHCGGQGFESPRLHHPFSNEFLSNSLISRDLSLEHLFSVCQVVKSCSLVFKGCDIQNLSTFADIAIPGAWLFKARRTSAFAPSAFAARD